MTDALTFDNRERKKAKLDLDLAGLRSIAGSKKGIFPSYFPDFCFPAPFQTLRRHAKSQSISHHQEPLISLATAKMAIV